MSAGEWAVRLLPLLVRSIVLLALAVILFRLWRSAVREERWLRAAAGTIALALALLVGFLMLWSWGSGS